MITGFSVDRPRWFKFVRGGIYGLAGLAAIATILGCAGRWWWGWELLDHPRPQYCWMLLAALLLGGWRRQRWSLIWVLPLFLNLGLFAPLFLPAHQVRTLASEPTLHLLNLTLDREQPEHMGQAIAYINAQTADLIWLIEVTPTSLAQLQAGLYQYQIVAAVPRDNSHGSALLLNRQSMAAIAVQRTQIIHLPADSARPMLETVITWAGHSIALLSFQATRPRNAETSAFQQVELTAGAAWSQQQLQQGRQVVMIGDFNTTPWSGRFRQLLQDSQLLNSQQSFGLQPTWNAHWPPLFRIAIDHCLHSQSLIVTDRAIGDDIGSDHLPLEVKLRLYLSSIQGGIGRNTD
ncbi:endonuclease/exonuclease/phosphatase family protein [Pantanalinema rosaneae CENA516]|uniref:endonuclease/exonuclease/phosphatase family protein n=1 Tax=Pantanalinema rosaneae TaxID=1620701 RepID=UPI003D6E9153